MQIQEAISLLRATCYAAFLKRHKAQSLATTEHRIEAFLTHLALQGVAASTQNQAFNALLFFYRYAN